MEDENKVVEENDIKPISEEPVSEKPTAESYDTIEKDTSESPIDISSETVSEQVKSKIEEKPEKEKGGFKTAIGIFFGIIICVGLVSLIFASQWALETFGQTLLATGYGLNISIATILIFALLSLLSFIVAITKRKKRLGHVMYVLAHILSVLTVWLTMFLVFFEVYANIDPSLILDSISLVTALVFIFVVGVIVMNLILVFLNIKDKRALKSKEKKDKKDKKIKDKNEENNSDL